LKPLKTSRSSKQPMSRINVSGEGLFCGARCIQGLFWTHYEIHVDLNEIIAQILEDQRPADGLEFESNNFNLGILRDFLARYARIALTLETDLGPVPPQTNLHNFKQATIWHTGYEHGGHYEYLGNIVDRSSPPITFIEAAAIVVAAAPSVAQQATSSTTFDDLLGLF